MRIKQLFLQDEIRPQIEKNESVNLPGGGKDFLATATSGKRLLVITC